MATGINGGKGFYPHLRFGAADMYGIGRGRVRIDYVGRSTGFSCYRVTIQGSIAGYDDNQIIDELATYFNDNTGAGVIISVRVDN